MIGVLKRSKNKNTVKDIVTGNNGTVNINRQ
jgi:hypothetical protein